MTRARQRVALVAPFFGRDLRGRKERYAFAYATHLALEGIAVEVITTTARADAPGDNAYRSGVDVTEAFPIHRFRVTAPDRVAYADAVLAVQHDRDALATHGRALLEERLRCPDLLAHVRAVGDRYDAFLFVDATASTTVGAVVDVAETALLVPLLDDEPLARVPQVANAISRARLLLCTTDAEAAMLAEIYGSSVRSRIRVVGLGAEVMPGQDLALAERPYVLSTGDDRNLVAALRAGGTHVLVIDDADERDRAALFSNARVVAITGEHLGFVPEVVEAWAYGRAVLVPASAHGGAALVRETGAGVIIESAEQWRSIVPSLRSDQLTEMSRRAASYVERNCRWERVIARTSDAIDALATLDDGRSRAALLAQIGYLYPLVQRQRRIIEAMRVSRFWRLRDVWFGAKRRLGIGPLVDPVPIPATIDGAEALAATGNHYQLFREQHRLRVEDIERMRTTMRFLPRTIVFDLVIDVRRRSGVALGRTLRSLTDQIYPHWTARVLVDDDSHGGILLEGIDGGDGRISVVRHDADRFGGGDFCGPLDPGDMLEPHALFECMLALQSEDYDVVYSDEDRLDERGLFAEPWFKPDWSPETLLTRDYVGRMLIIRRRLLDDVGGVRDVYRSAGWYDALLRVTERTDRIHHVAQVLVHRDAANIADLNEVALAAEVALRRRGEDALVAKGAYGVDVRFRNAGEKVTVVIPTRDRADLLSVCLESLFERTTYENFDVVLVDNGSREDATASLLAGWAQRTPERFRVIRDSEPFNYSRLNNEAVRATDAPYIVLLNNDTEVIAGDWMETMLGQARRPAIGAVGAMLVYDDDTVQHGGVLLGILGLAGHAHRFLPMNSPGYHGALQLDTNYLAVTAACLMVARRKYEEVGGLDEAFAVSSNDVDFCLRLRSAGYRNVYVPRARLRHYESKSRGLDNTPAKVARTQQEIDLVRARWAVWSARDPYYNPNLSTDAEDFEVRL